MVDWHQRKWLIFQLFLRKTTMQLTESAANYSAYYESRTKVNERRKMTVNVKKKFMVEGRDIVEHIEQFEKYCVLSEVVSSLKLLGCV